MLSGYVESTQKDRAPAGLTSAPDGPTNAVPPAGVSPSVDRLRLSHLGSSLLAVAGGTVILMANVQRVVVDWTGFTGAPGYTVHYRGEADVTTSHLATFYESVKAMFPPVVNVRVRNQGDLLDASTGALVGSWSTAANAATIGTGASSYAGGAGAVVRWMTNGISNGRRIRGRTFLVPCATGVFESNGTLSPTALTTINNAAVALLTAEAGNLVVWHRPRNHSGGSSNPVTASDVPDRSALLRSRRD